MTSFLVSTSSTTSSVSAFVSISSTTVFLLLVGFFSVFLLGSVFLVVAFLAVVFLVVVFFFGSASIFAAVSFKTTAVFAFTSSAAFSTTGVPFSTAKSTNSWALIFASCILSLAKLTAVSLSKSAIVCSSSLVLTIKVFFTSSTSISFTFSINS